MKDDIKKAVSEVLRKHLLPYAKAWVIPLVAVLARVVGYMGLELPPEVTESLATAITALVVYLVPNIPYIVK